MDNNIIILKDIIKMSDSENEEESELNSAQKDDDTLNLQPEEASDKQSGDEIKITEQDFQAALEKVIKKMFSDKIDAILEKVIEEIVTKEIKILKQKLNE